MPSTDLPITNQALSNTQTQTLGEVNTGKALDTSTQDNCVSTSKNSTIVEKDSYLAPAKLSKNSYGEMSERYNAIYKKIYNNKRLLQTEDLKTIDQITKTQNFGGAALTASSGSIFLSIYSKNLGRSLQMKAFMLGFAGFFLSMGALGHINWKYSKFLNHINAKYFYGTSIKDLKDQSVNKTNKPRSIAFEQGSWKIKAKLPSFFKLSKSE